MMELDPKLRRKLALWREDRQRARTDLFWLAKEVLQYKDLEERPHRMMVECVQKFHGGEDLLDEKKKKWVFVPKVQLWNLEGKRFRLMLWPRGHFKTTIFIIAHSIQWILNYPDIRILLSTAVSEQAERMMVEVRAHFQYNPNFRFLFPDYCPHHKKAADFGNMQEFTVPNRERKWLKEPSLSISSVGKTISSAHYEVLKFSDIVDKENVKTPNGIREVIDHIRYCDPLLERNEVAPFHGWKDIEGTRYAISDAYGDTIRAQAKAENKNWEISIESADPRDREDAKVLFPTRFPLSELQRIESEDPQQFSSQYRQRPIPESSSLATQNQIIFFPREALSAVHLRLHATIDLAGMESNSANNRNRNDYTVLNVSGFDRNGRLYVLDIRRARFTPFEVIEQIFDIWKTYKLQEIKIEKDAHARVLLPFFERETSRRGIYPVIVELKRDTRVSKEHRIRGLQSWFRAGIIRFSEDLSCKANLLEEILNFPDPSIHDDILDTIADQMQNRDGMVEDDVTPTEKPAQQLPSVPPWERKGFMGFEDGVPRYMGDEENTWVCDRTGM